MCLQRARGVTISNCIPAVIWVTISILMTVAYKAIQCNAAISGTHRREEEKAEKKKEKNASVISGLPCSGEASMPLRGHYGLALAGWMSPLRGGSGDGTLR